MKILFVCMGNICRSPMAEGYFRHLLAQRGSHLDVELDSAGTHGYHVGSPPDRRAIVASERRGIDITDLKARNVMAADFERFDYIVAMDQDNVADLKERSDADCHAKIRLFLKYSENAAIQDVPDPYYGGATGFERVLDLIEEAAEGLFREVEQVVTAGSPD